MDSLSKNDATPNLIHGSSNPITGDKPFSDPLRHVDRSREHRTRSVSELVKSAGEVCEAIDAARNDPELLARVLSRLVDIKMISKAEAAKTEIAEMSTISKSRKIDEHRDILLHPNVANKICSGHTIMYETSLLIDNLPDEDDAAEQLGKYLETLDGPLTRKWVQDLREKIAPKKRRKKKANVAAAEKESPPESADPIVEDQHEHVDTEDDVSGEIADDIDGSGEDDATSHNDASVPANAKQTDVVVADVGEPITAALLIVGKQHEGMLVHAAEGNEWQRMADQMAEDSAVFVFAPLQVLLNISRVIETFGCDSCANVYLLSQPDKLEATKCNVLAIFERGEGISVEGVPNWKPDDTPFAIAEQFLQGVPGRRLQIFADGTVEGWEALAFDDDYTPRLHRSPA
jgi:hypothetical protein